MCTEVVTKSPGKCRYARNALTRNSRDIIGTLQRALTPKVVGFGCIEAHYPGNLPGEALLAHGF